MSSPSATPWGTRLPTAECRCHPVAGDVWSLVRGWFTTHASIPDAARRAGTGPGGDAAEELAGIIDELYGFVEQNRLLLLLIESLVVDHPELSALRVDESKRRPHRRLAAFLASRAASGGLRPLADPEIAAHFLRESIAWFAQHRKRDPVTALIDDTAARSSVRELLLAAFVPDAGTGTGH